MTAPVSLTWPSLNWSPPNADTQGLMPPVPSAITASPMKASALGTQGGEGRGEKWRWGEGKIANCMYWKRKSAHAHVRVLYITYSMSTFKQSLAA